MEEVAEVIWRRNAELGQAERMWRISRAKNVPIPFLFLQRVAMQLMDYLRRVQDHRHASDLRTDDQLVMELALVYAIINHEMRKEIGARRLRDDLLRELGVRDALQRIIEADLVVAPDEEIVGDSVSAVNGTPTPFSGDPLLLEAPNHSILRIKVPP